MVIPQPFRRAFERFQNGEYARDLGQIEPAFYSAAKLARMPGLRFRRDIPPFLGAGKLLDGHDVVVTFGINPKRHHPTPVPCTVEEYFQTALEAFASGVPSSFHRRFIELLEGILGRDWREHWQDHYATFDMVPWYSNSWAVSRITKKQVDFIRPHLEDCGELLRSMSACLVVFNGRPWVDLLQLANPPVFDSPFRERTRVAYSSVDPRIRGSVLVGDICLAGHQRVPALVLTWFIQQTRPPFSFCQLPTLGEKVREELGGSLALP